jgi:hypothetical protein
VDIAFTSGVIPFRVIPQICSGRVENTPFKKNVTGISSNDRVKASIEAPIKDVEINGKIT